MCVVSIQEPQFSLESNKSPVDPKRVMTLDQPQAKENRKLERCLLVIRIHKKLELIKSKIPDLPHLPYVEAKKRRYQLCYSGGNSSLYQEEGHAGTRQTQVSEWFLEGLESVELDDVEWFGWRSCPMFACLLCSLEIHQQNTTAHERVGWTFQGISFGFGKFKSQDKLAVEWTKYIAKIQNLSITGQQQSTHSQVGPKFTLGSTERIPRQPTTQNYSPAFVMMLHAMIARLLTDDQNFRVIPIMGMQGIGKTTLANLIFNHKAVVDHSPLLLGGQMAIDFSYVTRENCCSPVEVNAECGVINTRCNEDLVQPEARMKLQKMLQKGTNKIRRLVDHLDKEDISFDHIHGNHNTTSSTSLTPYYEDVLSFLSFDTRKESKPGEEVETFFVKAYPVVLGLRSTFLEILPSSISKLQNVQTLDMKHTCINTLPNSIWKLQQLRHLHLSESCRSKLMLQHDTNIPTILQTLCGLLVDEETPVRDGLDRLKSIDESNQPWDLELKPLVSLVNLSYIYLLGRLRNPSIMSQFPYSLIDLTLSGSGLVEDPMQSLDKLPNLRSLKLLAKSYLGKNMLCSLGGFPQL
ncbi:hypothetical protein CK203_108180 [Vitis vinifera]|uniref:Uncharacterized protein n=1 Tax=Vitis vinifera TaxID=29760 RepID=A0A438CQ74_VITVI|nr:hypothetical protein CK203_108180 [Vitis vinifera]